MGKRFSCMLLAFMLVLSTIFGVRAETPSWNPQDLLAKPKQTEKQKPAYHTSALVSAMFLIVAGISVTLLFDKKKD